MMHLGFHGGLCCGIKVIRGFGFYPDGGDGPDALCVPLPAIKINNSDANADHINTENRFFHEEAPQETRLERLDRYIDYVRRRRPQHLIEVTLCKGVSYGQTHWFPLLEERGFKKVSEFKNSNSGNTVFVYHLIIGS